jgi:hypothetical protein
MFLAKIKYFVLVKIFCITLINFGLKYRIIVYCIMFWVTITCFGLRYHVMMHSNMLSKVIVTRKLTACSVATVKVLYLIQYLKLYSIKVYGILRCVR